MKVRSISFSDALAERVRAKLKWQTRRAVKLGEGWSIDAFAFDASRSPPWRMGVYEGGSGADVGGINCPYGVAGDRLWVRETHYRFGHWERKTKASKKTGRVGYRFIADSTETRFEKPDGARVSPPRTDDERERPQWYRRLARFMPRSLSRTLLEVVSVRVERLNAISEADAIAEGVAQDHTLDMSPYGYRGYGNDSWCETARDSFASLWRSINGADSWGPNWVWVVEFKVLP